MNFSARQPIDWPGYVRLAVNGPPLTRDDADRGILLIDGTWRHAARMNQHFVSVPARSLPGVFTAYPRVSKLFDDPPGGLASVEALFIAYQILGRPTVGLLDAYRWRDEFLRLNDFRLP